MIEYSIRKAYDSELFDRVIVSTDDEEIASIALQCGASVPFFRPKYLADDYAPTVPVIAHAISECTNLGWDISNVCCIYPCAPFIEVEDLIKSYHQMLAERANFIYPVTEYPHPIQRAMRLTSNGEMKFLYQEYEIIRTQDLEKMFHDVGQFYWGLKDSWLNLKKMHTDGIGFPIPNWRIVDIDTEDDWRRAELIYGALHRYINE